MDVQDCLQFNCPSKSKVYSDLNTEGRLDDEPTNETFHTSQTDSTVATSLAGFCFSHKFYAICGYSLQPISDCHVVDANDFAKHVENEDLQENFERFQYQSDDSDSSEPDTLLSEQLERLMRNDHHVAKFQPIASFPDSVVEDYTIAAVGTNLYVIGGFFYETLEPSGATWRYDTRTGEWQKMSELKHKRFVIFCNLHHLVLHQNVFK